MAKYVIRATIGATFPKPDAPRITRREAASVATSIARGIKQDAREARNTGAYISDPVTHVLSDGRLMVTAWDRGALRVAHRTITRYADNTGYPIDIKPDAASRKALEVKA